MDIFTEQPRMIGDLDQFPRIVFSFRLVDSTTQSREFFSNLDSRANGLIFPNCFNNLTKEEKIEFLYYIQSWFINRQISKVNGETISSIQEIKDTSRILDPVTR